MFRHRGGGRNYMHNLKLASILSFVAGIVNITGVLSVHVLTTNVTGHFAYFAEGIQNRSYFIATSFLLFIIFFLLGAFISSFLIEAGLRIRPRLAHIAPMIIEIIILIVISLSGHLLMEPFAERFIACALLFAMGLQNSLVTNVTQSIVRTTHLTGLFTDLGIELSQLFFIREPWNEKNSPKAFTSNLQLFPVFLLAVYSVDLFIRKSTWNPY